MARVSVSRSLIDKGSNKISTIAFNPEGLVPKRSLCVAATLSEHYDASRGFTECGMEKDITALILFSGHHASPEGVSTILSSR